MKKITKILLLSLASIVSACTKIPEGFTVLVDRQPIHSTLGFSFTPPNGADWYKKISASEITFLKKTNPKNLSFYAGAVEVKMRTTITTIDELLNFVKDKKDRWGSDKGRYQNTAATFAAAENVGPLCINYELFAEDYKANNIGSNKYFILKAKGIYCLHPDNTKNAVDIYYSVRYIPTLDVSALEKNGEAYLKGLKFISIQGK